jgi:hypothetical protein
VAMPEDAGPTALIEYISSAREGQSPRALFYCRSIVTAAAIPRTRLRSWRYDALPMDRDQDAAPAAQIEVAAYNVTDLDRRLGQIDYAIEEATKRGRTATALTAIEAQRNSRTSLAGPRQREASTLADLKIEWAALSAKGLSRDPRPLRGRCRRRRERPTSGLRGIQSGDCERALGEIVREGKRGSGLGS